MVRCLKERILEPYLKEHFWWMGDGVSPMNNWTIWCTQNVLMTAALWEEDEEISRAILQKAAKSADFSLPNTETTAAVMKGLNITVMQASASLTP